MPSKSHTVTSLALIYRPRMIWYDNAMEDLQNLALQNPREEGIEMAADRRVWSRLVSAALGLQEA